MHYDENESVMGRGVNSGWIIRSHFSEDKIFKLRLSIKIYPTIQKSRKSIQLVMENS
jgi:hypothetical protein